MTVATKVAVAAAVLLSFVALVRAQSGVTDADLEIASGGLVVRVGPAADSGSSGGSVGSGSVETWPLEVYVARVLAGEAEPEAADGAVEALAVAIRTFALANAGRHAGDGFDLCDGTHCQVPRAATAAARRAAMATAGQILTWNGVPAEVFYSASCGGHSESADHVWPGAKYPYMPSAPDDVHDGDPPWAVELALQDVQRALAAAGFRGRLSDVEVDDRSPSGRAIRLRLPGLQPAVIAGNQFRAAIGTTILRSTSFSIDRRGTVLRFTGRGYGHGVGMCVIGAGRRAARGESGRAILARYYPGLEVARLGGVRTGGAGIGGVGVDVPRFSGLAEVEVARLAARAHDDLANMLGTSVAPITVTVHESLEGFRLATGQPWWVRSVSAGTSIDLVPAALLAQPDGFDAALRIAIAELLVSEALRGRPVWVRVGAARYFARNGPRATPAAAPLATETGETGETGEECPSDAELTLAISAPAQRAAEARAEACFAREYARTGDWRTVR